MAPIIADPIFDPMYGQISRGVNLFPQRPPQQARAPRAPPTRGCIPNIARHSTVRAARNFAIYFVLNILQPMGLTCNKTRSE